MGIDISCNFGIGIEVLIPEEYDESNEQHEYLEKVCKNSCYQFFEVRDHFNDYEDSEYFIVLEDPFKNGFDIKSQIDELLDFLKNKNVETVGEPDLVGGWSRY